MARSRDQIIDELAPRQVGKIAGKYGWPDLIDAIQGWSPDQKREFVKLVLENNRRAINMLNKSLMDKAKGESRAFVESRLADSRLSMAELDELL